MSRNWTGRSMLNFNGNPSIPKGQPRTLSTGVCQTTATRSAYWLMGPQKKGVIRGRLCAMVSWDSGLGVSADREGCLDRCCDSQRLRRQNRGSGDAAGKGSHREVHWFSIYRACCHGDYAGDIDAEG